MKLRHMLEEELEAKIGACCEELNDSIRVEIKDYLLRECKTGIESVYNSPILADKLTNRWEWRHSTVGHFNIYCEGTKAQIAEVFEIEVAKQICRNHNIKESIYRYALIQLRELLLNDQSAAGEIVRSTIKKTLDGS